MSNYDREAPGTTASESLKGMVFCNFSAYLPALEAAQIVGDRVVRNFIARWNDYEFTIPH